MNQVEAPGHKWYAIENAAEIASPALLIYPDRVRENIRRMLAIAGGPARLRPHIKTHKLPQVIALQQAVGLTRFKCATLAEAELLARASVPDVLFAYQPVGPATTALVRLAERFPNTRFSTIVDDPGALEALSQAASRLRRPLDVYVDIDNGMHRTGIAPGREALTLIRQVAAAPGLTAAGWHVYDGHVRDQDLGERTSHAQADFEPVLRMIECARDDGLGQGKIIAGGTPTFPIHARYVDRECSPGTTAFWDASYAGKFPDLDFLPAAVLLSRVVSKPSPGRLCLDLGYKAVSPDNPQPRVSLLGLEDAEQAVHSEEHLAVDTRHAGEYRVGDELYGIPYHVCPTVALHQDVVVVEGGRAVDRWKVVARDRVLAT